MHVSVAFLLPAFLIFAPTASVRADAVTVSLANEHGATVTFARSDGRWRWTGLHVPGTAADREIVEGVTEIQTPSEGDSLSSGWTLAAQEPGKLVFEQESEATSVGFRRVFSFGPATNVVRIETLVRSLGPTQTITRIDLLDVRIGGETFRETGAAPASFPLFGQSLFAGIEHVSGLCQADEDRARLTQTPHLIVGEEWQFVAATVVGWTVPADSRLLQGEAVVRSAFLHYLETIRLKPADFELHTNTWWTLPLPFSEKDVLKDIESLRTGFTAQTGMFFDSFALDLGWSNNHSIWQVDQKRFPNEFRTIKDRLAALGAGLGLWVSPGSAYPEGLDNRWLQSAGYEVTPFDLRNASVPIVACFALGGRYQREFKENLLRLVRDYGIRHVKLDFMLHQCDVATHGHPTGVDSAHAIDAGLADVLDALRAVNPAIVLEPLCCGYPPSPWWTMKTPFVLGPHGDDVPYGRVPSPQWMESLITARDIAYRSDQSRWIMPTQALETFDIVMQSPGDFENLAVMAIGRGRWFLSTYLKPELMPAKNWDFLAALVRWARANREFLIDAKPIGGNPQDREAYGYMFQNPGKDIYCVRNPWIEERAIQLPTCASEPRELRMIYPRRETLARMEPGESWPQITLAPYETVMLEAVPAGDHTDLTVTRTRRNSTLASSPVVVEVYEPDALQNQDVSITSDDGSRLTWFWKGVLSVPNFSGAELCILVEGGPEVKDATGGVFQAGGATNVRATGSAGQFGAALAASPENWKWFTVPVARGTREVRVYLEIPAETASIGIYLRGTTPTANDRPPVEGPVFPVFHPDQRAWSQTLLPLQTYGATAAGGSP